MEPAPWKRKPYPYLNGTVPNGMSIVGMPIVSIEKEIRNSLQLEQKICFSFSSGAFSDVHVCREKQTGKDYAVKCIKRKEIEGREEALENEILIHRK